MTWANERASGSRSQKRVGGIEPGEIVVTVRSAFADGSDGPQHSVISPSAIDKSYFLRLDNAGPTIGDFHLAVKPNRWYPISRWVGAGYEFVFSSSSRTADFIDGGVGRSWEDYEYHAGTRTDDVSAVTAADDLAETFSNSGYVLSATVGDLLGNETTKWWAGYDADNAACTPAALGDDPTPEDMAAFDGFEAPVHCVGEEDDDAGRETIDATASFKFGVDLTAPTQELLAEEDGYLVNGGVILDETRNDDADEAPTEVFLAFNDELGGSGSAPSGFPVNPVHTRITYESPDVERAKDSCLVGWHTSTRSCNISGGASSRTGPGTDGTFGFPDGRNGYYFFEYAAMDNAGNTADFTNLRGILDTSPPAAVVSFAPPVEPGEAKTFSVSVFDNLDLHRVDGYMVFGDAGADALALQQTSQVIGGFGAPFEQNAAVPTQIVVTGTLNTSGDMSAATAYGTRVHDQAGNSTDALSSADFGLPAAPAVTFDEYTVTGVTVARRRGASGAVITDGILCWDVDDDGCGTIADTRAVLKLGGTSTGEAAVPDDAGTPDVDETVAAVPAGGDPFVAGVQFYVRANDDLLGGDGGTPAWTLLPGRGTLITTPGEPAGDGAPTSALEWSLNATAAQLAAVAGVTEESVDEANETGIPIMIRAVGYNADGEAMTGTTGSVSLREG